MQSAREKSVALKRRAGSRHSQTPNSRYGDSSRLPQTTRAANSVDTVRWQLARADTTRDTIPIRGHSRRRASQFQRSGTTHLTTPRGRLGRGEDRIIAQRAIILWISEGLADSGAPIFDQRTNFRPTNFREIWLSLIFIDPCGGLTDTYREGQPRASA